mmetsp:Transcript_2623/g.4693  ORF Transcript_2623/g.4693 Transcript_2623/m.4693 type:complete len:285 (+) Transcript_2623:358-1212(+)
MRVPCEAFTCLSLLCFAPLLFVLNGLLSGSRRRSNDLSIILFHCFSEKSSTSLAIFCFRFPPVSCFLFLPVYSTNLPLKRGSLGLCLSPACANTCSYDRIVHECTPHLWFCCLKILICHIEVAWLFFLDGVKTTNELCHFRALGSPTFQERVCLPVKHETIQLPDHSNTLCKFGDIRVFGASKVVHVSVVRKNPKIVVPIHTKLLCGIGNHRKVQLRVHKGDNDSAIRLFLDIFQSIPCAPYIMAWFCYKDPLIGDKSKTFLFCSIVHSSDCCFCVHVCQEHSG